MRAPIFLAALALFGLTLAAESTETPTEAVKAFYDQPGLETDPSARDRFVDPALTKLDQNDAIMKTGQGGCLDPGMAIDNVAANQAEIATSLKLAEAVKGDEAKVVASFMADGGPHRMEWKLRNVGGRWKVYDLMSVTNEWALSQFGCE